MIPVHILQKNIIKMSTNKKGTEINSMPQNTYESYRLLCLIIIPNKMYEEILFDIHTTGMKTRTTTSCITATLTRCPWRNPISIEVATCKIEFGTDGAAREF